MVIPNLRFDNVSLWLFVFAALVLLVPDIGDILSRVRRIKKGDLELELEGRLDELARRTEAAEEKMGLEEELYAVADMREFRQRVAELARDPRGGLITVAVEIEAALRDLSERFGIAPRGRYLSAHRVVDELASRGLLPDELPGLFRDFWAVRNQAVHSLDYEPSPQQLYEILDLGIRILGLLNLRRSPDDDTLEGRAPA
jgi:hypothetical protein